MEGLGGWVMWGVNPYPHYDIRGDSMSVNTPEFVARYGQIKQAHPDWSSARIRSATRYTFRFKKSASSERAQNKKLDEFLSEFKINER